MTPRMRCVITSCTGEGALNLVRWMSSEKLRWRFSKCEILSPRLPQGIMVTGGMEMKIATSSEKLEEARILEEQGKFHEK